MLLRQGCYADNPSDHDMEVTIILESLLSPDVCIDACARKEYSIAAVQVLSLVA